MKTKELVVALALTMMALGAPATGAERKILGEYFTQPN